MAGTQSLQAPQSTRRMRETTPQKPQVTSGRTSVGAEIPVAADCIMGVNAIGRVTQTEIDRLIAYLNLIKASFPKDGEATI